MDETDDLSLQDAFLFDDEFTDSDWHESITEGRTDTLTDDRSLCTITIVCDFSKYKSAVRRILGYSWVSEGKKLKREIPLFHPVWPWLWARAITEVKFAGPDGKETGIFENTLPFGVYTYALITIEFAETDFEIWKDNEVTYEWERFVSVMPGSHVELVQIDGGQLKAYAPSVSAVNGLPPLSSPFIISRVQKNKKVLTWRKVPHDFLYDADGNSPKIDAIQKRINSATWFGKPAGTVLCETAVANKKPMPIATDLFNTQQYHYDVELTLIEFDPPRGDTAVSKRGWNLLPGPRNVTGASGDSANAWFYYTHDGTLTGKPLYEEVDFAKFFTHRTVDPTMV